MPNEFSDEAPFCKDCVSFVGEGNDLTAGGVIRGPGKFEREHISTYHAYHVSLDGWADDEESEPYKARIGNVIIFEDGYGFVHGTAFDTEAEAVSTWVKGGA